MPVDVSYGAKDTHECSRTHGNATSVYSPPILLPITLTSEIPATHGLISAINPPLQNPYATAYNITNTTEFSERSQRVRVKMPMEREERARRVNGPRESARRERKKRPRTPEAFMMESVYRQRVERGVGRVTV